MPKRSSRPGHGGIAIISTCPQCAAAYEPQAARVVGEKDGGQLVHVHCTQCEHNLLALVLVSSVGVSSVGMLTDLDYTDVIKFSEAEAVSADDVLHAHTLVRTARAFRAALR